MLAFFLVLWWERKRQDTNKSGRLVCGCVGGSLLDIRQSAHRLDLLDVMDGKDPHTIFCCTPACATRARGDSHIVRTLSIV